jgi:adenylyl-sulfate kinase
MASGRLSRIKLIYKLFTILLRGSLAHTEKMTSPRGEAVIDESCQGFTLWLTGMSGAGKTTISSLLEEWLRQHGARVERLDGDEVRKHLSQGLGFSREDRDENVRRIGYVARLLSRNGVIAIVAAISPYRAVREELRAAIGAFVEVHVDCPMDVLIARDAKGLYAKALRGEISHFTGISDPYEVPLEPELVIDSSTESPEESATRVWNKLIDLGLIDFKPELALSGELTQIDK